MSFNILPMHIYDIHGNLIGINNDYGGEQS